MAGYRCPVNGCEKSFRNVDSLVSHVAGTAQTDSDHADQRDSDDHVRWWYDEYCVDDEQETLV